ncbi:MAG: DUF4185 domain-containing protein [Myxococcota bacterium]
MATRVQVLALIGFMLGCSDAAPGLHGEIWREANSLFLNDPRWIGGDGAYTVDLGGGRVLWLFGDSFVALSSARRRDDSYMVRNSLALQTGCDPTRAFLRFYYREFEHKPASFVPEDGKFWFWPGHGIRIENRLLLFYGRVFQQGEGMWGFATGSWTAFLVDNPDAEPDSWQLREVQREEDDVVQLGGAVIRDGDFLYVYGPGGDHHPIYLARFETERALAGDLTQPGWWNGSGYGNARDREPLFDIGAPEFSVHYAEALGRYVFTQTSGFGATTLAVRTAPKLEGPWSDPRDVLRPPESFAPDPFVYAGKAHPELCGADLVATYVPSAFETSPPDPEELLYYPRFAKITYR